MREREQRSAAADIHAAADTSRSADLSKLIASAQKNIKRTSTDIAALKQRKAKLDDQQRAAFRTLRDQLNELIGD
jgi:ParB family chromosome partitioning protein